MADKDKKAAGKTPRYTIETPNRLFVGERAGVPFRDGQGTTDDAKAAAFLRGLGYTVTDAEDEASKPRPPHTPHKE